MSSLRGQLHGRALDELDGARTNVNDRMLLVRQRNRDRVMRWRGF